jgi:hypothetical protein
MGEEQATDKGGVLRASSAPALTPAANPHGNGD